MNLSSSLWAPAAVRTRSQSRQVFQTSCLPKHLRQQTEAQSNFHCFVKLFRRLKWKSTILLFCHHRALHHANSHFINGINFTLEEGSAEMMFKIDFFEFYSLLERVLVAALGVWSIHVSAGGEDVVDPIPEVTTNDGLKSIVGDSRIFHGSSYHRFHANVLGALDQPNNPLHGVLGTGDVRAYLGIAKEFRNRWKDAQDRTLTAQEELAGMKRYERLLRDLKLEELLAEILKALEVARGIAAEAIDREGGGANEQMTMELDMEDVPLEAMMDAMEED